MWPWFRPVSHLEDFLHKKQMPVITKKYLVTAYRKNFYCKVLLYTAGAVTFLFGGKTAYCMSVSVKNDTVTDAYIDRIEYNIACVKDGTLEHKRGTSDMINAGLLTFHMLFPSIKRLIFTDDSHIHCEEGSKVHKISIAHDSILKYGKTWYEDKFKATLPSPLFEQYKESMKVLDEPVDSFEFQVERVPFLRPYEKTYEESSSPRDFIRRLRVKYGDRYCFEVGKWLTKYMESLRMNIFKDSWYISVEKIKDTETFRISETDDEMRGGGSPKNFSVVAGGDESYSIMGHTKI